MILKGKVKQKGQAEWKNQREMEGGERERERDRQTDRWTD